MIDLTSGRALFRAFCTIKAVTRLVLKASSEWIIKDGIPGLLVRAGDGAGARA